MKTKMSKIVKALAALSAFAFAGAATAETWEDPVTGITWTYTVKGDEVQIGDGSNAAIPTDTAGAVVIPSELGGKPVTSLGRQSFYNCSAMTSVTIPDTVTTFGYAFSGCDGLTSITIPHSVTNISSQEAFHGNANLENIYVDPANEYYKSEGGLLLTKDGKDLLSVPRKRTTLTVPEGVTRIRRYAVGQMYDLASIDLGSVEILDQSSIFICAALKDVAIPTTVTNIGAQAFYSCTQITNLEVAAENPAYKSVDGMVLTKDGKTLVLSSFAKESLTIPEGVETLAAYSVAQCNKITELTIPDGVKEIGRSALYGCSMLVDVKIPGSVTNIGNEAFNVCSSLKRIVLPNGLKSIGTYAIFNNRNVLDTIFIPPSLESFGANSLGSVAAVLTVYYNVDDDEGRVQSLIEGAGYAGEATYVPIEGIPGEPVAVTFDAAGGICAEETRTIGLGNTLGTLPDATREGWMFAGWYSEPDGAGEPILKSAVVMEPFTCHAYWIEEDGIDWKYRVSHGEAEIYNDGSNAAIPADTAGAIVIPPVIDGYPVTKIGYNAFHNCKAITSVTIPFGVTTIGVSAFYGCNGLAEIHLPRTVSSIHAESFCFANNIASITVDPANATYKSIDGVVYTKDGKKLVTVPCAKTEITIPDAVEEIGSEAFRYTAIPVVTLPESVSKVDQLAFYDSGIVQITISGGVTDIAMEALYSADSLVNVTIQPGEEPVTIGERAFKNNYNLESISIPTNVASIGADAFVETKLSTVYYSANDTEERVRALVEGTGYAGAVAYVQNDNPPAPKRTVTFNAKGGMCAEATREVEIGTAAGELPVPELEGQTFNGWWTGSPGGNPVSAETIVTANVTWYAHWTQTKEVATEVVNGVAWTYRVLNDTATIYNNGNAAVLPMPEGELEIPAVLGGYPVRGIGEYAFCNCTGLTNLKIPAGVTTVEQNAFYLCSFLEDLKLPYGFTFIGFGAFSNSGLKSIMIPETVDTIGNQAFASTALKTVYVAIGDTDRVKDVFTAGGNPCGGLTFEEVEYTHTVFFDGNGGTPGVESMLVTNTLAYGELPGATREGYALAGWFTEPTGGDEVTAAAIVDLDADQTLYAHWTANGYTVTFDPNGGTVIPDTKDVVYDSAYGELPEPDRDGYWEFSGWFTEPEGGDEVTAETIVTVSANHTLYAHWKQTWDPATIAICTADEYTADDDGSFDLALGALILSKDPPTVTLKGLPAGIKYTTSTGILAGKATKPGSYMVTVSAKSKSVKTPVTKDFTLVVPNLKDDAIPVADSYREMVPGVGYTVTIPEADGCTVSGLPAGMKWTAKAVKDKALGDIPANSAYGAPTKPGSYTVYFAKTTKEVNDQGKTVSVKHTATSTFTVGPFPVLTVDPFGYGTGKVTGAGAYPANKKVTLKATADTKDAAATATKPATVKSVFGGWYDGEALLSLAASYSYVMPDADKTLYAKFITAAEDAANISLKVNGVDLAAGSANPPYPTNVMCGVYFEWPVAATTLSLATVKVTGLPAGLKFTDKPITSKIGTGAAAVVVTNVPAFTIYGAPTAASKKDRDGNVVPSQVKVTVTTAGKNKAEYVIALTVDPIDPDWAVGTFNGGWTNSQATLTIAANGKISGKYLSEGKTWTLSAAHFDLYDEAEDEYVATLTAKSGKEERSERIVLSEDDVGGEILATGDLGMLIFIQTNWKAEQWKNIGKVIANKEFVLEGTEDGLPNDADKMTLKFAATGAVSVKGVFDMGLDARNRPVTYSATGSATLIPLSEPEAEVEEKPDELSFYCGVFVYLPPKAGKFDGFATFIRLKWTGAEFIPAPAE